MSEEESGAAVRAIWRVDIYFQLLVLHGVDGMASADVIMLVKSLWWPFWAVPTLVFVAAEVESYLDPTDNSFRFKCCTGSFSNQPSNH